jgi:hypothetical protein
MVQDDPVVWAVHFVQVASANVARQLQVYVCGTKTPSCQESDHSSQRMDGRSN